jgi:hypothetical protein
MVPLLSGVEDAICDFKLEGMSVLLAPAEAGCDGAGFCTGAATGCGSGVGCDAGGVGCSCACPEEAGGAASAAVPGTFPALGVVVPVGAWALGFCAV